MWDFLSPSKIHPIDPLKISFSSLHIISLGEGEQAFTLWKQISKKPTSKRNIHNNHLLMMMIK